MKLKSYDPWSIESAFIKFCLARIGADYELGGHGPKYDCSGLIIEMIRNIGWNVVDKSAADMNTGYFSLDKPFFYGPWTQVIFLIPDDVVTHMSLVADYGTSIVHAIDESDYPVTGQSRSGVTINRLEEHLAWINDKGYSYRFGYLNLYEIGNNLV